MKDPSALLYQHKGIKAKIKKIARSFSCFVCIMVFICLFIDTSLLAQDTTSVKYFPLTVGNVWYSRVVIYVSGQPYDTLHERIEITKDTVISEKKYFFVDNNWRRYDSTTSNLIEYSLGNGCSIYPNDKIVDSLASSKNDTLYCDYMGITIHTCTDTGFSNIFGVSNVKTKSFHYDGFLLADAIYAMNFGVIFVSALDYGGNGGYKYLRGCKINGIVYGDTSLPIIKYSSSVPENFLLYQNYPNPFNSTTKIRFDIPHHSGSATTLTTLKIYNILGQEVVTIVNEKLSAGSYVVDWMPNSEGGMDYPTGVYLYALIVGEPGMNSGKRLIDMKKMLLIK